MAQSHALGGYYLKTDYKNVTALLFSHASQLGVGLIRSIGLLLQMKIFLFLKFKNITVGQVIVDSSIVEVNYFILSLF